MSIDLKTLHEHSLYVDLQQVQSRAKFHASILEEERNRMVPMAADAYTKGLKLAGLTVLVLLGIAASLVFRSIPGATISTAATLITGCITGMFFKQWASIEAKLEVLTAEIHRAEQTRERASNLKELLKTMPPESSAKIITELALEIAKLQIEAERMELLNQQSLRNKKLPKDDGK